MPQQYKDVVIVIPTRNRADLAINALNSALSQQFCRIDIVVSDNSTEPEQSKLLEKFCKDLDNENVLYIQPPQPMPMTQHWDWVVQQAFNLSKADHITFLTDRLLFNNENSLSEILNITKIYPDKCISYNWDVIFDFQTPVTLSQSQWSGKLYEVRSMYILDAASEFDFGVPGLPKMMNSVVPKKIFEQIKNKYGAFFSSISPDYNFGYSCLTIVDSVLFYDKSILVNYASNRSNGMNIMRGTLVKESRDFLNNLGNFELAFDTPVHTLFSITNALFHEYCYVKMQTSNSTKVDFNKDKYLTLFLSDILSLKNQLLKKQLSTVLRKKLGSKYFLLYFRSKINLLRSKYIIRTRLRSVILKLRGNSIEDPLQYNNKPFPSVEKALAFNRQFPRRKDDCFGIMNAHLQNADRLQTNIIILDIN